MKILLFSIGKGGKMKKETKNTKRKTKKSNSGFKTSEVVFLIVLTALLSLGMGYFLNNRFGEGSGKYDKLVANDEQLKKFIDTYGDIIDNYYAEVDKKQIISDAIDGLFNSLDGYSDYLNPNTSDTFTKQLDGEYEGVGIEVVTDQDGNIVILTVFEDTPAEKAGLQPMDIVKRINDIDLSGKESSDLVNIISNSKSKSMKLLINREGEDKEVTMKKDKVVLKTISSEMYDNIGYIRISLFASNTADQFKKTLLELENKNIDGLVIDLRDNAGGHLTSCVDILSQLMSKDHVIYQVKTKKATTKYYSEGSRDKKYPIVVLINEKSASASEVLAAALKEQLNAKLVGITTYGKGTIQEMQELRSGDSYKITTKKWLTSKGIWIDGTGLKPDVSVKLNDEFYETGTPDSDNQLQEALQQFTN